MEDASEFYAFMASINLQIKFKQVFPFPSPDFVILVPKKIQKINKNNKNMEKLVQLNIDVKIDIFRERKVQKS